MKTKGKALSAMMGFTASMLPERTDQPQGPQDHAPNQPHPGLGIEIPTGRKHGENEGGDHHGADGDPAQREGIQNSEGNTAHVLLQGLQIARVTIQDAMEAGPAKLRTRGWKRRSAPA